MDEKKVARLDEILSEINTLRNEAVSIASELKNSTNSSNLGVKTSTYEVSKTYQNQTCNQTYNQSFDTNKAQNQNFNAYVNFNQTPQASFKRPVRKTVDTEKIISKFIIPVMASVLIFVGLISLAFMVDGRIGDALQVLVMYLFSGMFCFGGYKVTKSKVKVLGESLLGCGIGSLFLTTYLTYSVYHFINQNVMIVCMLILMGVFTVIAEKYNKSVFKIIAQIGTIFPILDLAFRGQVTTAICLLTFVSIIMIFLSERNDDYTTVAVQNLLIQLQLMSLTISIYYEIHRGATLLPVIYNGLLLIVFVQNVYHYATNYKVKNVNARIATVLMMGFSFIGLFIGLNATITNLEHLFLVALGVSYIVVSVSLFKSRIGVSDFLVLIFNSISILIFTVFYSAIGGFLVRDLIAILPLILLIYLSQERKERNILMYILMLVNMTLLLGNAIVSGYDRNRSIEDFTMLSIIWYANYFGIFSLIVYDFFGKGKLFSFAKPLVTAYNARIISLSLPLVFSMFMSNPSKYNIIHFVTTRNGSALWLITFIATYTALRHSNFLTKLNSIDLNIETNRIITEIVECVIALWGCVALSGLTRNQESYTVVLQSILAIGIISLTLLSFKDSKDLKSIYRYIKTLVVVSLVLRNLLVGDFAGAVIGLVWLVLATILILCGFKYKTREVRMYGLYLAIVAVIRLVLIDIPSNSSVMTVLLYITGGLICFGIVLMYNKVEAKYKQETEHTNIDV